MPRELVWVKYPKFEGFAAPDALKF